MPLPSVAARPPDEADRAAADLAAAALASRSGEAEATLDRIEAIEAERAQQHEPPTGLQAYARDVVNAATADGPVEYREASRELLERDDLDPALRARLEQTVRDDPVRLAEERIGDARVRRYGGAFNLVVAPLARNLLHGVTVPIGLARATVALLVREWTGDELTRPERQALHHWRSYLARSPDAPEAEQLRRRIADAERRLRRTRRDHLLRRARRALEEDEPRIAADLAGRTLRLEPEDAQALALRKQAQRRLERRRAERQRSFEAPESGDVAPRDARELALSLLVPHADLEGAAGALLEADPEGALADEAAFALALARGESGREDAMWERFRRLAEPPPERSNMARHAAAAVASPRQNPYRAFRAARAEERLDKLGWVFLGSLADGPRDLDMPDFFEWMIEVPNYLNILLGTPNRAIRSPWLPASSAPAVHARGYLRRYPEGEHAAEVREFLRDYEKDRGNYMAALRVARGDPGADAEELAALSEKAAEQALEVAKRDANPFTRIALLREIVREYPDTESGREAGRLARLDAESATPQRIRLTRGFLVENRSVAGPKGIGLAPGLLDGELRNGELHPIGVSFVGGRDIEIAFVAESGDEDDAPVRRRHTMSDERLARTVALLDEVTRRNERIDPDDRVEPDPARDLFFERARLGVADSPDRRALAHSSYTFQGLRERYGLVRGRESILPVELVIQGSLDELSLGAFPRIRMPEPTPDAILFE